MGQEMPKQKRGRFFNRYADNIRRRPFDFFLWLIGYYRDQNDEVIPQDFSYPIPERGSIEEEKPWALWINHSTYLIHIQGRHLLTDPIFSNRCSPLPPLGPKRHHLPGLSIEQLPPIDYVLISHDHYDHLDKKSVLQLQSRFPKILWIVPRGVKKWFLQFGIKNVVELAWWEQISINSLFKVTAVPAQHFSGRVSTQFNKTLWLGWVVEDLLSNKKVYFAGDTGYNQNDFKRIGEKFAPIDLALIPIGSYSPRKFMAPVHVEPKDAVRIHREVGSALSLGMHWKTFCLSDEPMHQPPYDLYRSLEAEKVDPSTFLAPEPGRKINF